MKVMNPRSLNEIQEEKQAKQDKDLIIADLMQQNALLMQRNNELAQQVDDISLVVADLQLKVGGSV